MRRLLPDLQECWNLTFREFLADSRDLVLHGLDHGENGLQSRIRTTGMTTVLSWSLEGHSGGDRPADAPDIRTCFPEKLQSCCLVEIKTN